VEASHRQWTVQPRFGLLRRILFPVYGRDQLIFFAVFAIIAVIMFAAFDAKLALYMSVGGYVGAMVMMEVSTPSSLVLPVEYERQVVEYLDRARFLKRTGSGLKWINARGRMYRWDTDTIRLERIPDGMLVTGGHYDLGLIAEEVGT